MTRRFFLLFAFALFTLLSSAQNPQYTKADSITIMKWLSDAPKANNSNIVIYFARQLRGIPYVAATLEKNSSERLVINTRQLDCTTYVENVLALSMCVKNNNRSFNAFCNYLQKLRYLNGEVSYKTRLHYFTEWIADNTRLGFVKEISTPNPPFTSIQTLNINYMSTNPNKYPMLVKHPSWTADIAKMEKELNGKKYAYIPKTDISNTKLFRSTIKDGDIIAIITNKKGLDTSHIGIAVWHKDGLHMLNASMIHHKVVEEPMLLRTYMSKHPSQKGIRIIRVL